ncbi:MAG TPA: hypothetical protein VF006_25045 [Longimicrobium sp.]
MQKVRLDLDELEVQSFTTTGPERPQRGTVQGNEDDCTCQCCPTDPALNTCWASCPDTCWATCGDTCGDSCGCGSGDCGSGGCGSYDCGSYGCGSESFLATNCR